MELPWRWLLQIFRLISSQKNLTLSEALPSGFLSQGGSITLSRRHSIQWKHPSSSVPKNAMFDLSAGKMMVSVILNAKVIVFIDNLQNSHTINGDYCVSLLRQMPNSLKRALFHQNSDTAQKSFVSITVLCDIDFELVHQPPFPTDLIIISSPI